MSDLYHEAMFAQALDDARYVVGGLASQNSAAVTESMDVEFTMTSENFWLLENWWVCYSVLFT